MAAIDDLITELEQSIETGLGHFSRLWDEGKIKIGRFGPREDLCQMMWWVQATAEGAEAVASGGTPYRIYASDEEMDARAVGRAAGLTIAQMAERTRGYTSRLTAAVRQLPELNTTILIRL